METDITDQAPDRGPVPAAEVRSALLGLLRLLAHEVARRLPAPDGRNRAQPPSES